ncbi:MAG: SLC13 family permease [Vicingaceae bacterium]|nr:MAG: SLC13 family permease [Vicingaceae bacterium]
MQKKYFKLLVVALILILEWILLQLIGSLDNKLRYTVFAGSMMIACWVTELVPLYITGFLPLLIFPLLGVNTIKSTAQAYGNPVIFVFIGGFFIATALEKHKVHLRMALWILKQYGDSLQNVLYSIVFLTAILSMWISNTATAILILPVVLGVLEYLKGNAFISDQTYQNFSKSLVLSIAYAANAGGIATIIGTPPNLVAISILDELNIYHISFSQWLLIGVPFTLLLLTGLVIVFKWIYPVHANDKMKELKKYFLKQYEMLGPPKYAQKASIAVMSLVAILWITKDFIAKKMGITAPDDATIAVLGIFLLFIIPSKNAQNETLLTFEDSRKVPWDLWVLFGGGLALADALDKSGILKMAGGFLIESLNVHSMTFIVLLGAITILFTEFMSNVAQVTVLTPLIIAIARESGLDVLPIVIYVTILSSCGFMMPMGTPPNAIAFGTGFVSMKDMMKTGFLINLVSLIVAFLLYLSLQSLNIF